MSKTAVQQIIDKLQETKDTKCTKLHEMLFFDGVLAIIEACDFLEIEKSQIKAAHRNGTMMQDLFNRESSAETYYTATFDNQK